MVEVALLWHVAREFDLFSVLRENERNIELNSGNGLSVRFLCLKLEALPGNNVGVVSRNLRPKLLDLCDRGLVFFENGNIGVGSQQTHLYRLPPQVIEYVDSCELFLKNVAGDLK